MAQKALEAFCLQTLEHCELLIFDDADSPSFPDGLMTGSMIYYDRIHRRMTIAEKRNLLCEAASAPLICHWDDDDWSAPTRLSDQLAMLESSGVSVAGYHSMLFHSNSGNWKYHGEPFFALGTSLLYRKSFWSANQFRHGSPNPNVGEDNNFVNAARNARQIVSVDAGETMVARIHDGNTSHKRTYGIEWKPWAGSMPEGFAP